MKTTLRDLDSSVIEKLNRLDNVIDSFDEQNPDGFVSYGPNGFYFKKTNDTFLKKVFNEDEIVDLEKCLTEPRKNVLSSYYKDFRLDDKLNKATQKFLYNLKTIDTKFDAKIANIFLTPNNFWVLLDNGNLRNFKSEFEIKLINILESNFSLTSKIAVHNIVNILEVDSSMIIILTDEFGIYKFKLETEEIELLNSIKDIKDGAILTNGNLFIAGAEFCAQYDLKTGLRVEKYSNIVNERQIPERVMNTSTALFVQAVPAGCYATDNLIHLWKLDQAGVAYNCADKILQKLPVDKNYQILYATMTKDAVLFSGKIENKIFIWKILLSDYSFNEEIIDCLDTTVQYNGFFSFGELNIFLIGKKLFIIKENTIIENLLLDRVGHNLVFFENELYSIADNIIRKIEIPKFESKAEVLSYEIYNSDEPCNNIDIFVKGASRNERLALIDMDTGREIPSSFYFVYKSNSIIKLMNCKATRIKMVINVSATSSIEGIVVKNNRMFLR